MSHLKQTSTISLKNLKPQESIELSNGQPRKRVKLAEHCQLAKKSGKRSQPEQEVSQIEEISNPEFVPAVDELGMYVCQQCQMRFERRVLVGQICKFCWLNTNHLKGQPPTRLQRQ